MELLTRTRIRAASMLAAGGLALLGCGGGVESNPAEPKSDVAAVEVEDNTGLEDYQIVKLAEFQHGDATWGQDVTTYQETYDFNGLRWICSLTITDGGRKGGTAKSCTTTPIKPPLG